MSGSGFDKAFHDCKMADKYRDYNDYDRGLAPECYPDPSDPLYGTGIFYKSREEEEEDDD